MLNNPFTPNRSTELHFPFYRIILICLVTYFFRRKIEISLISQPLESHYTNNFNSVPSRQVKYYIIIPIAGDTNVYLF